MLQIERNTITVENTDTTTLAESKMTSDAKDIQSAGFTVPGHRAKQHAVWRAAHQRGGMWKGGRRVDPSWLKKLRLKLRNNGPSKNGMVLPNNYYCAK